MKAAVLLIPFIYKKMASLQFLLSLVNKEEMYNMYSVAPTLVDLTHENLCTLSF